MEFPTEFSFQHGIPHGIQLPTWNSHGIQLSTWNSPWNSTFIMEFPTEFIHNYMITGFPSGSQNSSRNFHSLSQNRPIPHGITQFLMESLLTQQFLRNCNFRTTLRDSPRNLSTVIKLSDSPRNPFIVTESSDSPRNPPTIS